MPRHAPAWGRTGWDWRSGVLLASVSCAAFAVAVRGGFVLDDTAFLPDNPKLDAVSSPFAFFATRVWDYAKIDADVPLYRPVFMLVLWAGHAVLGADASRWHVLAILLHVCNVLLVWRLARRLVPTAPPFASLAGALLFAVHPVHVEAVAWILAYVHPLTTLLALLAAHAQLDHASSARGVPLLYAASFSAAAMLTSEGALVVPALVLGLDAVSRRRVRVQVLLAHLAALIAVLSLRAWVLPLAVPLATTPRAVGRAVTFLAAYVRMLVLPWPQHVYMSLPDAGVAGPLTWPIAAMAAVASIWLVWRGRPGERVVPALAVAWVWLSLLPPSAGAMNSRALFAPRAAYLASVGVALLGTWLLRGRPVAEPLKARAALALVTAGLAVACTLLSLGWRDDLAVYTRVVAADPDNAAFRVKVGELLDARGERAAAEAQLRRAVSLPAKRQERLMALEALATHLGTSHRLAEAEQLLREVLASEPGRSSAWVGIGNVAYLRGDREAARDRYLRAFELDPNNFEAASNLSLVYFALGDRATAAAYHARAEALRARR